MSNIDFESINENFPADGRDNSTQGFRDNFDTIKTNFQFAKTEIEAIANASVTTSSNNNFNNNSIINTKLLQTSQVTSTTGLNGIVSNSNISYLFGHLHAITLNNSVTMTFTDWPTTSQYSKIRVVLFGDGTAREINFQSENSGTIKKGPGYPTTVTVTSATDPVVIDAWTYDGSTVYLEYVGAFA
jgi:hypothetical protein